jgi:hypothetical protein
MAYKILEDLMNIFDLLWTIAPVLLVSVSSLGLCILVVLLVVHFDLHRKLWPGEIPGYILVLKLSLMIFSFVAVLIAVNDFVFTLGKPLSLSVLWLGGVIPLFLGYGYGAYGVLSLTKCTIKGVNKRKAFWLAIIGIPLGFLSFLSGCIALRYPFLVPYSVSVLSVAYVGMLIAAYVVYTTNEGGTRVSGTRVSKWEWLQYLGPAVILHFELGFWAFQFLEQLWYVWVELTLFVCISGLFFVAYGIKKNMFAVELDEFGVNKHEKLARYSVWGQLGTIQSIVLMGTILLFFASLPDDFRLLLAIFVGFVSISPSLILIEVRWWR